MNVWWSRLQTIFMGLTFVTFGAFFIWQVTVHNRDAEHLDARITEVNASVARVEHEVEQQRASTWVAANGVLHNCLATNDSATCTVTNVRDEPITTCVRGVLTKRDGGRAPLSSLPMCTGRLGPRETRTISVPWSGGFARDLCSKKSFYGETLDWQQCDFSTEPVDLPAQAKAAALAAIPAVPFDARITPVAKPASSGP